MSNLTWDCEFKLTNFAKSASHVTQEAVKHDLLFSCHFAFIFQFKSQSKTTSLQWASDSILNAKKICFQPITAGIVLMLFFCMFLEASAASVPIEQAMSERYSVRDWTSDNIPSVLLLETLRSAYGYSSGHRSIPLVGNGYSLVLFVANATGTYKYSPQQNTLTVYDLTLNKEVLRSRFNQGYPSNASAIVIVVWDQTVTSNPNYASAEAGFFVQNMYLAAVSNSLGTVCVALIDSASLRADLKLPSTMTPMLVMPIGYPMTPYSSASPDSTRMNGNLPAVQYSTRSYTEALSNLVYAQSWSSQTLSTQELSQLLWAAYGYSSTGHRTVPSAGPTYGLQIWLSNATGIYQYSPQTHSVTQKVSGDKRANVASASGGQSWAASAPVIFLVVYDSSVGWDSGIVPHNYPIVEAGCVVQQLLLEASAWGMSGNVVGNGLEDWNGAAAAVIRNILGLSQSIIPLFVVPIGHEVANAETPAPSQASPNPTLPTTPTLSPSPNVSPSESPTASPTVPEFSLGIILPAFTIAILIVVTLYIALSRKKTKKERSA
ncbi:MAG: nitroreductase family protein [Chloroflexi bacterium]|nr:nitroreductase family protein [Chloroflexota bacterium]